VEISALAADEGAEHYVGRVGSIFLAVDAEGIELILVNQPCYEACLLS